MTIQQLPVRWASGRAAGGSAGLELLQGARPRGVTPEVNPGRRRRRGRRRFELNGAGLRLASGTLHTFLSFLLSLFPFPLYGAEGVRGAIPGI